MHSPRQLKRLRRNNAGAQSDSSEDEIEQVQLMDTNSEQDSEEVSGGETQQDAGGETQQVAKFQAVCSPC